VCLARYYLDNVRKNRITTPWYLCIAVPKKHRELYGTGTIKDGTAVPQQYHGTTQR